MRQYYILAAFRVYIGVSITSLCSFADRGCGRASVELKDNYNYLKIKKRVTFVTLCLCGATRTLFSLFYLIAKIKRNKKCIEI